MMMGKTKTVFPIIKSLNRFWDYNVSTVFLTCQRIVIIFYAIILREFRR
jgi:hypothetical protein